MIVHGKNPVFEAVKTGKAKAIYIRKGAALYNVSFENIPVKVLEKREFDSRFSIEAQGVAAEVDDIVTVRLADVTAELKEAAGVVILDKIQDPHNFGAIVRSAYCFGVRHIVIPRYEQAGITPAVCKASAGAIFYCTVIEETNLSNVCVSLKGLGFRVVACDMGGEDIRKLEHSTKNAVIVGSEGRGIRDGLAGSADVIAGIPITGEVGSLNAAQSAAIAFFSIFAR